MVSSPYSSPIFMAQSALRFPQGRKQAVHQRFPEQTRAAAFGRDRKDRDFGMLLEQAIQPRSDFSVLQPEHHETRLMVANRLQQFVPIQQCHNLTVGLRFQDSPDYVSRHPLESYQQRSRAGHDTVLRFRATERAPHSDGCECIVRADLDSATAWIMWPAGI